jgi:hypothetical protein
MELGGPAKPKNPHTEIACLFCHMEQPPEGASVEDITFRTLEGTGVPVVQVKDLCEMCHPGAGDDHTKVLAEAATAEDLGRSGLPVPHGLILCSTCHEMHGADAGPSDVRLDYAKFTARSVKSYPHGNRVACKACHPLVIAEGEEPVFLDPDPEARCTRCHVEDHAKIHPVSAAPTEKTYPMEFLEYPLDGQGRATCTTCHDHVCRERIDPKNPRFLRGAPYLTFTEFCYRCHPKAGVGGLSPHEQVNEDGEIVSTTCTFCHRVIPEDPEGGDFREEDLLYLRTPVELCFGCHDMGPHPAGRNHLVELRADMPERLREYEEKHKVRLPLDQEGRVVCSTCHNPHAKGVLRGQAALGAGEDSHWRVPSFAQLCAPCHGRYD